MEGEATADIHDLPGHKSSLIIPAFMASIL